MWIDDFDTSLASLWEYLVEQPSPQTVADIHKGTGLPVARLRSGLNQLSEVGLAIPYNFQGEMLAQGSSDAKWLLKKSLNALDWARAVESGIPLSCLEKGIGLSVEEKKKAQKAISSGQVDEERRQRRAQKMANRHEVLRGRAASRAAVTDLAQVVQDATRALENKRDPVSDVFREEAKRALEALINAMAKV